MSLGDNYAGLGQLTEAEKAYREVMRITGGSVEVRMRLALVLSKQGRDAEAETLLRGAVEASPRNTNAHLALSVVLSRQCKSAEAEKEDRNSLELEPNNPGVEYIAYAMLELGERLEEALKLI